MNAEVLIFTSKDDFDSGFECAKRLADRLTPTGAKVRLVHKLGFSIEDLRACAQHKIVSTPCVVVMSEGSQLYRKVGLPSEQEVRAILCAKERRDEELDRQKKTEKVMREQEKALRSLLKNKKSPLSPTTKKTRKKRKKRA